MEKSYSHYQFWQRTIVGFLLLFPLLFYPFGDPGFTWAMFKVVLLLAMGILGVMKLRSDRSLLRSPFSWLVVSLFVLSVAGILVSIEDEWVYSILGGRRFDGVLYLTGATLFGLLVFSLVRSWPALAGILQLTVVAAAAVQAAIVLLQLVLPAFVLGPVTISFDGTLPGTLGHPGFVGGLLMPAVVIGVWLWRTEVGRPRTLVLVALLLVAIGLGVVGNRASFFALVPALFLLVVCSRNFRIAVVSAILVLVVLVSNQSTQLVRDLAGGSDTRVQQDYSATNTLVSRLEIWRLALQALPSIPGSPLLGGGPSAFTLALNQHASPTDLARFYHLEYRLPPPEELEETATLFASGSTLRSKLYLFKYQGIDQPVIMPLRLDRAHNAVLDRLLSYGLPSVLIWLAIFLVPIWQCVRFRDRRLLGLGAGLAGVMIYYLAWFPVPQVEPFHLLLAATAWAIPSDSAADISPVE